MLCLGALGITTLKLLGNALTAQRRPLLETAGVAVAFVTVFALDFLLIPAHGGLGASIASAASYTLGGLAVAVIFARALGARPSEMIPGPADLILLVSSLNRRFRPAGAGSRRMTGERRGRRSGAAGSSLRGPLGVAPEDRPERPAASRSGSPIRSR